ncbi:hypothetical protein YPPY02_4905, partial [Yersinia pestis PY-02]
MDSKSSQPILLSIVDNPK